MFLLSDSGKTASELATFWGNNSWREWLKQWEQDGLDGLTLKPSRGRKPKLNLQENHHVQVVKTLIENAEDYSSAQKLKDALHHIIISLLCMTRSLLPIFQ